MDIQINDVPQNSMFEAAMNEEKLREASCYGDLEAIRTLLKKGVNINSQHSINGW